MGGGLKLLPPLATLLHEPQLVKSCIDIKQSVNQPLHVNNSNHTQYAERDLKLTTTASGRIVGAKGQIGIVIVIYGCPLTNYSCGFEI